MINQSKRRKIKNDDEDEEETNQIIEKFKEKREKRKLFGAVIELKKSLHSGTIHGLEGWMKICHNTYEDINIVLNLPTTLHGHIIRYHGEKQRRPPQYYIVIKCIKQLTPDEAEGIIVDGVFTDRNDVDSLFLEKNNSLTDGDIIEIKSKVVHECGKFVIFKRTEEIPDGVYNGGKPKIMKDGNKSMRPKNERTKRRTTSIRKSNSKARLSQSSVPIVGV